MKRAVRFLIMSVLIGGVITVFAQGKIDEERMSRDIEIAENVLQTLLRQEFGKRNFFPYEVNGTYLPGYGVTFRLPNDFNVPMGYMMDSEPLTINYSPSGTTSVYSVNGTGTMTVTSDEEQAPARDVAKLRSTKSKQKTSANTDSVRTAYNTKIIEAAKTFLADYGDLISQLSADERIVITNRGDGGQRLWYGMDNNAKRSLLSVDAAKGDVTQYKQGKLTRDQLLGKIKVVNTESVDELNPDLELLSSIFNRLYRPDLSKTYYSEGNIYYERLKDFGVIYYMNVVSSSRDGYGRFTIPTLKLDDIDQATRDKKVKELYPAFEKEVKENVLEYGRTLRSLNAEENLIFNVRVTQCAKCGIPSSLEYSVKNTVLNDYNTGKLTKEAALEKIAVKKGPNQ